MSIIKKAISLGTTAALLASLAAVAVAPAAALASATDTNFGTVVQPFSGTNTSGPFGVTITESSMTGFGTTGTGEIDVAVTDKNGASTGITLGGTLAVTAPGYAGVTASVAGNVLTIDSSGPFDPTLLESISVSGITVTITSAVPVGALKANVTVATGDLAVAGWGAGGTASGLLHTGVAQTTTTLLVDVSGTCAFVNATGATAGDYYAGTTDLGQGTVTALAGGQQTITLTTGLSAPLAAGVTITQTSACAAALPYALASPGSVVAGVKVTTNAATIVQPGENNQKTGTVVLTEAAGQQVIGVGTLTFTVAGAVFSKSIDVEYTGGLAGGSVCSLNFDRTACTVSITSQSTAGGGTVTLGGTNGVFVDVPASAAQGASVTIAVAGTPAFPTTGSPVTVANVARLAISLAAQPTVFIGFNDQPSGMLSITETQAGFFSSDPSSPTNAFAICLTSSTDHFTRAPIAVVTAGDLKLAAGSPIAPVAQATGALKTISYKNLSGDTVSNECAVWNVYTSSSVASTIQIRGTDASGNVLAAGATNGVNLSIDSNAQPGTVQAQILLGTTITPAYGAVNNGLVGIAVRAFKNQPVVAALGQPTIPPGTSRAVLGNLTITETQAGQFKPNEEICVDLVKLNTATGYKYQAHFITTAFTADQPVITTNNTTTTPNGLLVSPVDFMTDHYFCFHVSQQATGSLGQITISNMVVYTPTDAAVGPLLVDVSGGYGTYLDSQVGAPLLYTNGQAFEQTVSNAIIGNVTPTFLDAASAAGVTTTGPFTLSTKVVKKGTYVTIMIKTTPAMAGAHVGIWIAKKGPNGVWSKFSPHTGRIANGSGVVYYYYKAGSLAWLSIRGFYSGDATHAASWSNAVQVKFVK